jgi:hypothetical protein
MIYLKMPLITKRPNKNSIIFSNISKSLFGTISFIMFLEIAGKIKSIIATKNADVISKINNFLCGL